MTRTILVTGAGRGLGRTLAEQLTERGDEVIAHARSESALKGVACAHTLVADLERPETIAAAVERAGVDALDGLVHNAGIALVDEVADQPLDWWQRTLAVNVIAAAELTRTLLPALRAARGHVVFMNSGAGLSAGAKWASYAASKHALKALADALRQEERSRGVRVTSLYPSHFDTAMQRSVREQYGSDYDPRRAVSVESIAATTMSVLDTPADMVINELRVEPPDPLPIRDRS